ncbi:PREDICTED: uncharacterized protein LOC106740840 isoform X2 [Dinoponera quadriceps]|uniref:Uncharacterized protein LOC106740840 isoform X2 n=1 Tax=Dinoponera quadriceps TaxID=609295 RepID=A0A6P3WP05_DINQU|nr:PREDICTED: uncharacterized protein LOC106740840 isoform X2 [Dinoponera quadriceps]
MTTTDSRCTRYATRVVISPDGIVNDEISNILSELSESDVEGIEEISSEGEHIVSDAKQKHDVEQDPSLSDNSSDRAIDDANEDVYVGRDKITLWRKTPCASGTADTFKEAIKKESVRHEGKKCGIVDEASALFEIIDNGMLEEIVACTNLLIEHKRLSRTYSRERDVKWMTRAELLALIGLLYLTGVKRANHTNLLELWTDDGTGLEICRSTMSYRRFLFLLDCLRFDDRSTRTMRLRTDKLALVRNVWEKFVQNCRDSYSPSEQLAVGDRLQAFRGSKCNFVQYMANRSCTTAKYGLRIVVLVDIKTSFTCNMELCCGQQPDGPYRLSDDPAAVVHRLIDHVKGSFANVVTCDGRYASYPLVVSFLDDGVTFLGAVGTARPEVPLCFLPRKSRPAGSSLFGFRDDVTLVSHVSHEKNKKTLIMLSSRHHSVELDPRTNRPVIVEEYSAAKDAMDAVERTRATHSVSRRTTRWPLAVFFALLDVAGMNAQVLYNVSRRESPQKYRRVFLKNLALALLKPQLQERAKIKTLPVNIRAVILHQVGGCEGNPQQDEQGSSRKRSHEVMSEDGAVRKKGRCFMCGRAKNTSTTLKCHTCSRFTCKRHMACIKYTCEKCETKTDEGSDSSGETSRA